jgi:hypothetical protein
MVRKQLCDFELHPLSVRAIPVVAWNHEVDQKA